MTPYELSMFFTIFVFLSFWNLFNAKAFDSGHTAFFNMKDSKVFFLTLFVIIGGQFLLVSIGGEMFNVVPLSATDWGLIIGSTALVMIIPTILTLIAKIFKR
jgi:Ca2+-transporting ATPase